MPYLCRHAHAGDKQPLARRRGLPVEPDQILGVDADPAALVALVLLPSLRLHDAEAGRWGRSP